MTAPLSKDLRHRLIAAVEDGQSCRSAAKRLGGAASTAIKWVSPWREEGLADPKPFWGGAPIPPRPETHAEEILGR
uniref:Transposase and inactivated derivatives n=1 Tax=Magnetospirillum gryphiswaldense TaxID=55518 RepID=A4U4B2_9PROT|nr:transposase and inactivated derivatives [Magnetospirillum gryphiswaldense MSR-1]